MPISAKGKKFYDKVNAAVAAKKAGTAAPLKSDEAYVAPPENAKPGAVPSSVTSKVTSTGKIITTRTYTQADRINAKFRPGGLAPQQTNLLISPTGEPSSNLQVSPAGNTSLTMDPFQNKIVQPPQKINVFSQNNAILNRPKKYSPPLATLERQPTPEPTPGPINLIFGKDQGIMPRYQRAFKEGKEQYGEFGGAVFGAGEATINTARRGFVWGGEKAYSILFGDKKFSTDNPIFSGPVPGWLGYEVKEIEPGTGKKIISKKTLGNLFGSGFDIALLKSTGISKKGASKIPITVNVESKSLATINKIGAKIKSVDIVTAKPKFPFGGWFTKQTEVLTEGKIVSKEVPIVTQEAYFSAKPSKNPQISYLKRIGGTTPEFKPKSPPTSALSKSGIASPAPNSEFFKGMSNKAGKANKPVKNLFVSEFTGVTSTRKIGFLERLTTDFEAFKAKGFNFETPNFSKKQFVDEPNALVNQKQAIRKGARYPKANKLLETGNFDLDAFNKSISSKFGESFAKNAKPLQSISTEFRKTNNLTKEIEAYSAKLKSVYGSPKKVKTPTLKDTFIASAEAGKGKELSWSGLPGKFRNRKKVKEFSTKPIKEGTIFKNNFFNAQFGKMKGGAKGNIEGMFQRVPINGTSIGLNAERFVGKAGLFGKPKADFTSKSLTIIMENQVNAEKKAQNLTEQYFGARQGKLWAKTRAELGFTPRIGGGDKKLLGMSYTSTKLPKNVKYFKPLNPPLSKPRFGSIGRTLTQQTQAGLATTLNGTKTGGMTLQYFNTKMQGKTKPNFTSETNKPGTKFMEESKQNKERTENYFLNNQKSRSRTMQVYPKLGYDFKTNNAFGLSNALKQKNAILPLYSQNARYGEKEKMGQSNLQRTNFKYAERVIPKQAYKIIPRFGTPLTPKTPYYPKTPKILYPPIIPNLPGLNFNYLKNEESNTEQGYYAYAKDEPYKNAKFVKLNKKPLSKLGAKSLLFNALDNTISQTGKIAPANATVKRDNFAWLLNAYKFYSPKNKPNNYTEKRDNAIDTFGEVNKLRVSKWIKKRGLFT